MKQNASSNSKRCLILLLFLGLNGISFAQESSSWLKTGLSIRPIRHRIGGTLQLIKVLRNNRWKLSTNYHMYRSIDTQTIYVNGKLYSKSSFRSQYYIVGIMPQYLIIQSKKDPALGLSIGVGPSYSFNTINNSKTEWEGPGGSFKIEYQHVLGKRWAIGGETYYSVFANQLHWAFLDGKTKIFGMPFILTVGYKLHK